MNKYVIETVLYRIASLERNKVFAETKVELSFMLPSIIEELESLREFMRNHA